MSAVEAPIRLEAHGSRAEYLLGAIAGAYRA